MVAYQIDFKVSFLHESFEGPLKLYVEPPKHFEGTIRQPGSLWKLFLNEMIHEWPNTPLTQKWLRTHCY